MEYYIDYRQDGTQNSVITFPSSDNHLFLKKTDRRLFIHIPSRSNNIKELVLSIGFLRFLDGFFIGNWRYEDKISRMILISMPLPIPFGFYL